MDEKIWACKKCGKEDGLITLHPHIDKNGVTIDPRTPCQLCKDCYCDFFDAGWKALKLEA